MKIATTQSPLLYLVAVAMLGSVAVIGASNHYGHMQMVMGAATVALYACIAILIYGMRMEWFNEISPSKMRN